MKKKNLKREGLLNGIAYMYKRGMEFTKRYMARRDIG
jgi:hypothetical protein